MSTVKTDNILGSNSPYAAVEGINDRETIQATSGQIIFTISKFDHNFDVLAFRGNVATSCEWIASNQVQISVPAVSGQYVHFYRSTPRAKSIKYEVAIGDYQTLQSLINKTPNPTNGERGLVRMASKSEVSNSDQINSVALDVSAGQLLIPVGGIIMWPAASTPEGFVALEGQELSRSTYSKLFSIIGTSYGVGNGSTTFNVPDFRGNGVRGWDNGRNIDVGRVLGSEQLDAIQNIVGTIRYRTSGTYADGPFAFSGSSSGFGGSTSTMTTDVNFDASRVVRTATETRMRNISTKFIMRHGANI